MKTLLLAFILFLSLTTLNAQTYIQDSSNVDETFAFPIETISINDSIAMFNFIDGVELQEYSMEGDNGINASDWFYIVRGDKDEFDNDFYFVWDINGLGFTVHYNDSITFAHYTLIDTTTTKIK